MDRDRALERRLLQAAGDTGALGRFADERAHPGPVRLPRDFDQEIREELADAANYACWAIQSGGDRERLGRVLACLVETWRALQT